MTAVYVASHYAYVQKDDVDLACKKFSRFVNPLESLFLEK
jgi:hypothetical protein